MIVDTEQLSADTLAALEQFDDENEAHFRHLRGSLNGMKGREAVERIRHAFATGFERGVALTPKDEVSA